MGTGVSFVGHSRPLRGHLVLGNNKSRARPALPIGVWFSQLLFWSALDLEREINSLGQTQPDSIQLGANCSTAKFSAQISIFGRLIITLCRLRRPIACLQLGLVFAIELVSSDWPPLASGPAEATSHKGLINSTESGALSRGAGLR